MPLPPAEAGPGRELIREHAYRRLRDLIVAGTLEPGELLRDQQIAAWLGASRTPVREALSRLADDGLVEIGANRYTRVVPLDPAVAAEAHRGLALLEGELVGARAADTSDRGVDDAGLLQLADRFTWALWRGDVDDALAADSALHAGLRDGQYGQLAVVTARLEPIARRAQRATWSAVMVSWPAERHAELIAALQRRDAEAARSAIADEWRTVGDSVARAMSVDRTDQPGCHS